jgi:hypothetical protein
VSEKRTNVLKIRVSNKELELLLMRNQRPQLARWMREHCLDSVVPNIAKVPSVDPALLRQVSSIGNNLNQIARVANSSDWGGLNVINLLSILASIQTEIGKLK